MVEDGAAVSWSVAGGPVEEAVQVADQGHHVAEHGVRVGAVVAVAPAPPEAQEEKDGDCEERRDSGVHGVITWLCSVVYWESGTIGVVCSHIFESSKLK